MYTTQKLVTTYRAMSPMLTKIEGLVVNTNTGKAPKLAPYYQYWESIIYDGIKQVRHLPDTSLLIAEAITCVATYI